MSFTTIWTSELVENSLSKLRAGMQSDLSCFYERNFELRNGGILFKLTPEEFEEYKKCSGDIVYFVEKYCKFLTDKGRSLIKLRKFQKEILIYLASRKWSDVVDDFIPEIRNYILMAARQSSKTTTIVAYFVWYLIFNFDKNCLVMANKDATAREIVSKITYVIKSLPFFFKPGILNITEHGIRLDNGSQLLSQATTKTASIGFTIHVLYMDEFAHIPANIVRSFWRSVYPTLSSSEISQCIISSTPAGTTNLFFELWDKSIKKLNDFVWKRVDYWEIASHDAAWAERERRNFGEEEFAQEFELQFNVDSKLLLASSHMSFMKRIEKEYNFIELSKTKLDDELYRNLKWHPDFDPDKDFDPLKDKFLLSVDTAEGKEEGEKRESDYNVIKIYKIELKSLVKLKKLRNDELQLKNMLRFKQVGVYRDNCKDEANAAKVCKALVFDQLGEDCCNLLIEMNYNGKNFVTHFSDHEKYYEGIIIHTYHTKPIPGEKLPPKKPGFKVTSDKEYFCKLGKRLIGEKTIITDDTVTSLEFTAFGKNKKGKYCGLGMHDDTVMATLNVSRVYENDDYLDILYDFLENYPDCENKRMINKLLKKDEEENSNISDSMFDSLYGSGEDELQNINNIFNNSNKSNERYNIGTSFGVKLR